MYNIVICTPPCSVDRASCVERAQREAGMMEEGLRGSQELSRAQHRNIPCTQLKRLFVISPTGLTAACSLLPVRCCVADQTCTSYLVHSTLYLVQGTSYSRTSYIVLVRSSLALPSTSSPTMYIHTIPCTRTCTMYISYLVQGTRHLVHSLVQGSSTSYSYIVHSALAIILLVLALV